MIFQNYSQTYAAGITALVGIITASLPMFGIQIMPGQLEFIVGLGVNVVGVVWTLLHRNSKGDVTALGFRK